MSNSPLWSPVYEVFTDEDGSIGIMYKPFPRSPSWKIMVEGLASYADMSAAIGVLFTYIESGVNGLDERVTALETGGGGGEGLPCHYFTMWADMLDWTGAGKVVHQAYDFKYAHWVDCGGEDSEAQFFLHVSPGDYDIVIHGASWDDCGILDVYLPDDTLLASIDFYSASPSPVVEFFVANVALTEPTYLIKLVQNGKNASSTGFHTPMQKIEFHFQPS